MQRLLCLLFILLLSIPGSVFAQPNDSTEVFLITCLPGNEVATIYGHSAIRVVNVSVGFDQVYSWGVYDFSTPNFVWKFAKGRLNYKIDSDSYEQFLQQYISEQRTVFSQRINFNKEEKIAFINLVNNNMLPENRLYLYDFFYDNCATRIRDLLEKTFSERLVYPDEKNITLPTFRERINEVQKPIPWLSVGTDLLIGISGDKKAGFRERMFLPEDLRKNLALATVNDNGKLNPLLQNPIPVLEYKPLASNKNYLLSPLFIFCIILIVITLVSILIKRKKFNNYLDIFLFLVFSILSVLMVFFNFFTDHQAMKMNLNIIWLNPLLIPAFVSLITKRRQLIWFRIILLISTGFLLSIVILPQTINMAFIPLILILIIRSVIRSRLNQKRLS